MASREDLTRGLRVNVRVLKIECSYEYQSSYRMWIKVVLFIYGINIKTGVVYFTLRRMKQKMRRDKAPKK